MACMKMHVLVDIAIHPTNSQRAISIKQATHDPPGGLRLGGANVPETTRNFQLLTQGSYFSNSHPGPDLEHQQSGQMSGVAATGHQHHFMHHGYFHGRL